MSPLATRGGVEVHVHLGRLLVEAKVDDVRLDVRGLEGDQLAGVNCNRALCRVGVRWLDSNPLAVKTRHGTDNERACRLGVQLTEDPVAPDDQLTRGEVEQHRRVDSVLLPTSGPIAYAAFCLGNPAPPQ